MYVRGYLQGSENGRVATIGVYRPLRSCAKTRILYDNYITLFILLNFNTKMDISNLSWNCIKCGLPNFGSSFFYQSELSSFSTNNKGNNKITELRTILQRESQNS
jgi:hypothetical protein